MKNLQQTVVTGIKGTAINNEIAVNGVVYLDCPRTEALEICVGNNEITGSTGLIHSVGLSAAANDITTVNGNRCVYTETNRASACAGATDKAGIKNGDVTSGLYVLNVNATACSCCIDISNNMKTNTLLRMISQTA